MILFVEAALRPIWPVPCGVIAPLTTYSFLSWHSRVGCRSGVSALGQKGYLRLKRLLLRRYFGRSPEDVRATVRFPRWKNYFPTLRTHATRRERSPIESPV